MKWELAVRFAGKVLNLMPEAAMDSTSCFKSAK